MKSFKVVAEKQEAEKATIAVTIDGHRARERRAEGRAQSATSCAEIAGSLPAKPSQGARKWPALSRWWKSCA